MTMTTAKPTATDPGTDQTSGDRSAEAPRHPLSVTLGKYSALFLWAAFMIIFGLAKPHVFLSVSTLRLTAAEGVVTAILALAFLVPLAAGAYDLSIGAMMGLSLVVVNWFGANHPSVPIALVAVGSVVLCCLVGLLSGIIVVQIPGQLTDRHPRHEPGPDRRRVEDLQQPPDHRRLLQPLREPRQPQRGSECPSCWSTCSSWR